MKKIKQFFFLLLYANSIPIAAEITSVNEVYSWNIFIYAEASEGLQKEAVQNIFDIARAGVPENVHIGALIHTHGPNAWLLSIVNNHLVIEDFMPLGRCPVSNIVQSAARCFIAHPAEKYGMVLWDHGFGVLEPTYDTFLDEWVVQPDGDEEGTCTIASYDLSEYETNKQTQPLKRSMLVDAYNKTCLHNRPMVEACEIITTEVLGGKKLEFLAMDLCMGSMLEIGYQIREYVNYITGTQDCELADGLDYYTLMGHFQDQPNMTGEELVAHIVQDYYAYFIPITPFGRFSQSAINLHYTEPIKNNLDAIVEQLLILDSYDHEAFKTMMLNVREQLLTFCIASYYKDLHQIYGFILQELPSLELPADSVPIKNYLADLLAQGQDLIDRAVVANMTGPVTASAHGISIYWPRYNLDASYSDIPFAQESSWLSLLEKLVYN